MIKKLITADLLDLSYWGHMWLWHHHLNVPNQQGYGWFRDLMENWTSPPTGFVILKLKTSKFLRELIFLKQLQNIWFDLGSWVWGKEKIFIKILLTKKSQIVTISRWFQSILTKCKYYVKFLSALTYWPNSSEAKVIQALQVWIWACLYLQLFLLMKFAELGISGTEYTVIFSLSILELFILVLAFFSAFHPKTRALSLSSFLCPSSSLLFPDLLR